MAPRGPEQRRADRVPIEVLVQFTVRGSLDKIPGVSRDISVGGMFIDTAFPAQFGSAVLIGLTLPGQSAPMLLSGTVRWTSASGMGVQFGLLGARETHGITEIERAHRSPIPAPSEPTEAETVRRVDVHQPRMTTEDRRAAIARAQRLHARGMGIPEIAEAIGVSTVVVQAWLAERR